MKDTLIADSGLIVIGIYILFLIFIGLLGRKARKEYTVSDFFLAGEIWILSYCSPYTQLNTVETL